MHLGIFVAFLLRHGSSRDESCRGTQFRSVMIVHTKWMDCHMQERRSVRVSQARRSCRNIGSIHWLYSLTIKLSSSKLQCAYSKQGAMLTSDEILEQAARDGSIDM